ncbi:MarR family winged helix-turn-helix transcriptional regulator [Thermodesulfobacteriota bacterium]
MDLQTFDPNDSLATLLNKTTRALSTRLQSIFTNAGHDVTSEQWMILLLLWQQDGRSPWQIAGLIGKDRAAVTRLVDGLERRGLVVRVADKTDRRHKQVHLTPRGKAMENKLIPLGLVNMQQAQSGLSKKELESCKAVLRTLYRNLTT